MPKINASMKTPVLKSIITFMALLFALSVFGQRKHSIVKVIDDLRYSWDETAISLKDYQGIQTFCLSKENKQKTFELLDAIHHWDTTLYFVVQEKYENSKDKEAAATLRDIETLEKDFTTLDFKAFIQEECTQIKVIRDDFDEATI